MRFPETWKSLISDDVLQLVESVVKDCKVGSYPPADQIFRALELVPPSKVKVVILGQDPYHGKGQANGLAFSVNPGIPIPPSLKNIFKEIKANYPETPEPSNGDLTRWAEQGVLLLNSTLTVMPREPGSHFGMGWEEITDAIIQAVAGLPQPKVFMLWGSKAKQKLEIIEENTVYTVNNVMILKASHPSPYSADYFFGCRHFEKANHFLIEHYRTPIRW